MPPDSPPTRRQALRLATRFTVAAGDGTTLDRWTEHPGGDWDNRPTTAYPDLEPHGSPGINVRHADKVSLRHCKLSWGDARPDYFTHALEVHNAARLTYPDFVGEAAHPERDPAIVIK